MKLLSLAAMICLLTMAGRVTQASAEDGARQAPKPGSTRQGGTLKLLSKAGVESPEQIEAVILSVPLNGTYKVTYKDSPSLVSRIYEALQAVRRIGLWRTSVGSLTLVLPGGKAIWFAFSDDPFPPNPPQTVFLTERYSAPKLLEPIREIKANTGAAVLDSRVGDISESQVHHLEVRIPRSEYIPSVPPSSEEGRALLTKVNTLLDWLDLRTARARAVGSGDVSDAGLKFGYVAVYLKTFIPVTLAVWDESNAPRVEPDPIGDNVSFHTFRCSRIRVLDYGNYRPPLLALYDMDAPDTHYLCPYLTRRGTEAYAVRELGLEGHPLTDKEYYKSPEVLYEELQELAKTAYEKWKPQEKEGQ